MSENNESKQMHMWKLECPNGHQAVVEVMSFEKYIEHLNSQGKLKEQGVFISKPYIVGGCYKDGCEYRSVTQGVDNVQIANDGDWNFVDGVMIVVEDEEEEVYSTVTVHKFTDNIEEHTCEKLLAKENYGNYYMVINAGFGWSHKTGDTGHTIFNCPYCGDELK